MTPEQKDRLEAAGWKVGSASEFLGLTPEDETIIAMRIALTDLVKRRREQLGMSQHSIAKRIGSGQGRISKIEANSPTVSFDLLIRAVAATGATLSDIAEALQNPSTI